MDLIKNIVNILVLLAIVSCGMKKEDNRTPGQDQRDPAVVASPIISDSFVVNASKESVVNKIGITKDALGKEFLLRANVIWGGVSPAFRGTKTRIVVFKKVADELFLLEATKGLQYYNDLPQEFILASFPIKEETDELVYFDFDDGMKKLYILSDWYSADSEDLQDNDTRFTSVKVENSYLELAEFESNVLSLNQVAQVGDNKGNLSPVKTYYRIEPYQVNPSFTSTKYTDFSRFGYFGVAPMADENGQAVTYASKFDHNKKVVYGISANTPAEYVDAIKEGILYWNKAFGKEVLEVVVAPEGVTAPNYNYNMVQWVDWKGAGFAFADAQMDPRTGEILNSQIFMTSVFAIGGEIRAKRILRKLKSQGEETQKSIALKGFSTKPLCSYEFHNSFATAIDKLLEMNASDQEFLKLSQDYVREVMAHEVGHTMGLRHNFAGTLHTNIETHDRDTVFDEFVTSGTISNDIITTSSVMDYSQFVEATIAGHQIKTVALAYDDAVIKSLYYGQTFANEDLPLFCTDGHVTKFIDCNRFDYGKSVVDYARLGTKDYIDTVAEKIAEYFISVKSPLLETGAKKSFSDIKGSRYAVDTYATELLSLRNFALAILKEDFALVSVYRQFESSSDIWIDDIKAMELEWVSAEVEKNGGWEQVLAAYNEDFVATTTAKFNSLVDSEAYRKGEGSGGAYEFTAEEIASMKVAAAEYFEKLYAALLAKDVEEINGVKDIVDNEAGAGFANYMLAKAKDTLFTVNGTKDILVKLPKEGEEELETVTIKVPQYKHSKKSRYQAATYLLLGRGAIETWGIVEKAQLKDAFKEHVKTVLGERSITDIAPETVPTELAEWLVFGGEIEERLSGKLSWY